MDVRRVGLLVLPKPRVPARPPQPQPQSQSQSQSQSRSPNRPSYAQPPQSSSELTTDSHPAHVLMSFMKQPSPTLTGREAFAKPLSHKSPRKRKSTTNATNATNATDGDDDGDDDGVDKSDTQQTSTDISSFSSSQLIQPPTADSSTFVFLIRLSSCVF
jgi:hypothetical protein